MTIDEAIEHAEKRSQECNGSKCGQEHLELARWLRELRCLRLGMPDLDPVIAWLENGCSPRDAAKELRIYQQRMRSNHDWTRRGPRP